MLPRTVHRTLVPLTLALAACDGVLSPELQTGNVDPILGAAPVTTDTGVVVSDRWCLRVPSNGKALWLDRFLHFDFGGFPELQYPQNTRFSDAWRLQLTHEKTRVTRNDSTILSFVDHGDAAVADSTMEKLTTLPYVLPGSKVAFENWVRYLATSYTRVIWLAGNEQMFQYAPYHDRLVQGQPISITTTGSAAAGPVTATFSAYPTATLTRLENGDSLPLNASTPPVLNADRAVVFTFDRSLDPDRSYLLLIPFPHQKGGAQRVFLRLRSAGNRVVIPPSLLGDLIANAGDPRVAYEVVIHEYWWKDNVFVGAFAQGGDFSLPFVQESETVLLVYLER